MKLRILVTGSRSWDDRDAIRAALIHALGTYTTIGIPVLVHGAARGADTMAEEEWRKLSATIPGGLAVERHPARDHATPLRRNAHMVSLGATICCAFASGWATGTGNCARLARAAGIHTIDYGADTRPIQGHIRPRSDSETSRQLAAMMREAGQLGLYEQTAEPRQTR